MRLRWRAEAEQSQKAFPVQQREGAGTSPPNPLGERPPAPRLLHELSIILRVEHLCAMVLLDVHPSPTLILQLLLFQHLRQHSEGWSEAFPSAAPGWILALLLVEEFCDGERPPSSSNIIGNLRELRRQPFGRSHVQIHDLPSLQEGQSLVDVGRELSDH